MSLCTCKAQLQPHRRIPDVCPEYHALFIDHRFRVIDPARDRRKP